MSKPVGELKKLVSLVDRGDADEFLYPAANERTVFQQDFKPYHNFSQETIELPYTGAANWGQRITFTMPYPWLGDCLSWIAIRFSPNTWLSDKTVIGLSNPDADKRWNYNDISGAWLWASGLGSSAIELVEMEVNGVVIERWSGDWINVWQKTFLDPSRSAGWSDSVAGTVNKQIFSSAGGAAFYDNPSGEAAPINTNMIDPATPNLVEPTPDVSAYFAGQNPALYATYLQAVFTQQSQIIANRKTNTFDNLLTLSPTEDGSVYAYFPFWFARHKNSAFPMTSIQGEGNLRFHITFRKFSDVIRKVAVSRSCDETMLGKTIILTNNDTLEPEPFNENVTHAAPNLKDAALVCGVVHLDNSLRESYLKLPHETMMEPVLNIPFSEPLKYAINTGDSDKITVILPLDAINGPVREIIWFIRRKAAYKFNSWNNYGAYLEDEVDNDYNPQRPLLSKAVLRVGSVVWADQEELWWRSRGALSHPGGIQLIQSYIYAYSFAENPSKFGPTGSINGSRVPLRLELTIDPPTNVDDKEWEVQVFVLSNNWMKFQNGIAEVVFKD